MPVQAGQKRGCQNRYKGVFSDSALGLIIRLRIFGHPPLEECFGAFQTTPSVEQFTVRRLKGDAASITTVLPSNIKV